MLNTVPNLSLIHIYGVIHISLSNVDADEAQEITINLGDTKAKKAVGESLTGSKLTDCNSFEKPNIVKPRCV